MSSISKKFLLSAAIYGLLGMAAGLHMAIGHDYSQRPTHAHIMVIGWLSFAIFGIFYHIFKNAVPLMLSKVHFWLSQISFLGLIIGLWLLYSGNVDAEPIAAVSSIGYTISFLVFALVVFKATSSSDQ